MKKVLYFFLLLFAFLSPRSDVFADTSVTSNISTDTTWTIGGGVYIIQNSIAINSGVTLTIDPGVVVKFQSSAVTLSVNGALSAFGTATSSVYFTSYKDDTVGGDTNGDGSATSPSPYDWTEIKTGAGATTTLVHATVRYGGYMSSHADLYNNGGTLNISTSTISYGGSYGVYHDSGATEIDSSTLNNSGEYGIWAAGTGTVSVSESNFYNNSYAAGYFNLSSGVVVSNSDNTAASSGNRGFVMTGTMNENQTWNGDGIAYIISDSGITVPSGKTLTVEPGAVVKFSGTSAYVTVNGALSAEGTVQNPIYFTSIKDDTAGGDTNSDDTATSPSPYDWTEIKTSSGADATLVNSYVRYGGYTNSHANLYNNGGTLNISDSMVSYGGTYGVYHDSGSTNIASSTFNNSDQYGIEALGSGTLSIVDSNFYDNSTAAAHFNYNGGFVVTNSGNTASGSGKRGFIVGGTMNSDQEWATDLPYIINNSSSFVIPSGKTLTIDPDAVVKFDGGYAAMTVNGTLSAQQGAIPDIVNIVYFTSIHDDTVGGDTNGNGDATLPETYDWEEIKINSGGSATLEHSFIGYGGYYDCHANLCNDGGTLNVSTSTIAYGGTYGIYHAGGATNVSQSVFRNNGGYGLYNSTLATTTATGNYWGSVTGPYNAKYNPSGTGNAVSDYVNFNPWLGEDHYVDSDIAAVNGGQILWEWAAGSTQTYSNEWDNAVAAWNTFNPIDIISATSTLDLVVEEVDEPGEPWVGAYDWEGSPHAIGLNKAKLSNRAPNQIQNTATHELGHALGLLHSYWENIMYPRNTFQTIFGPQDEYDYDYLWND